MANSATLYAEACNFVRRNSNSPYWQKNFYLQILTTMFQELLTTKTSPLISKFCADSKINFEGKNFKIEPVQNPSPIPTSFDMGVILLGLAYAFTENIDTCATVHNNYVRDIFRGQTLKDELRPSLLSALQTIDDCLEKFHAAEKIVYVEKPVEKVVEKIIEKPVEKIVEKMVDRTAPPKIIYDEDNLMKTLDDIAQNRKADDEKIVDEIKKVQQTMQDELNAVQQSLKKISEIREEIDYRSLKEPIYQLIELYRKIDDNVKRHPMEDTAKGYSSLMKRCESFLKYVNQSLKMLGVELINETDITFNPDKNKLADDEQAPLDSTVTKIIKVGFIYKGQVLEKAEVEISKSESSSTINIPNFSEVKADENRN
ncbi:MAG: nucleotide exchange factor GrpE [Selenomonadaceae bacterium]|nr:nucleotide exchange factor GrpE [Selenomonadaceae bacterium]